MPILLEVCAGDVESARAAAAGGADRLELCSALEVGGVTPGPGTLRAVREAVDLPLVVLARPRRGDFLYTLPELAALAGDVDAARDSGAQGVALGVLDADARVDREATARIVERARPLEVTFHRAFDLVREPEEALEVLVELGVERVLTSGGAPDVVAGLPRLKALVAAARGRIGILPGGGVRAENAARVVAGSGVSELHLSATRLLASRMVHRAPALDLGAPLPGEYELRSTSADVVRAVRDAIAG